MKSIRTCIAAAAILAACDTHAAFVDWISIDLVNETASGTLGSMTVTLTTTQAASGPLGNGGVVSATLDGTDPGFSSAFFTPSIALTDKLVLGGASSFSLHFSQPITNPTLHLLDLANNTLNFNNAVTPILFTLVSSDGNFNIPTGGSATAIQGQSLPNDSNGSLFFAGTFSDIAWTTTTPNTGDLFAFQVSSVPEPSTALLGTAGLVSLLMLRKRIG